MKSLDMKSKFNIYSSFTLSNDDVSTISLLYAPLIGSGAFMLYFAFQSFLERNNLKSEEISHESFFEIYSLKPTEFIKFRNKLEGIGLLVTYYNSNDNKYIYVVCPPFTAKNFIKDVALGLYLYSKLSQDTFDLICNHFKIEKIDKQSYENITKRFDEVYESNVNFDESFNKFQYLLGKKPNNNIKINNNNFDIEIFLKEINKDFLETGVTSNFKEQISTLSYVYRYNENEMINLYADSINKSGLYDYRLLKKNAIVLFNTKRHMKAPILEEKNQNIKGDDLITYLDEADPQELLDGIVTDYPATYLQTFLDLYSTLDFPRGVINCMIIKVLREKGGDLPNVNYFKKVAENWVRDNIYSTKDAIKYITTSKDIKDKPLKPVKKEDNNGGITEL